MSWKALNLTWHYVEKWASLSPESEALVFQDERLSWRTYKQRMDDVARAFLACGVEQGERIAMLSMARTEFMITYMAAGKVGAMWLGLNPKFTREELRYQLTDARPAVLVMVRDYMGRDLAEDILALKDELPFLRKILVIGEPFEGTVEYATFTAPGRPELEAALKERSQAVAPEDSALLMYTSGSTGKPKGVVQTHGSILANGSVMISKLGMTPKDRILLHFPINHVASDVEIGFSSLMGGGTTVFMERFDPGASLEMIVKEKITVLGQVPVMYLLQMQTPQWKALDWHRNIRYFVVSGAIPPAPLIEALKVIKAESGCLVNNAYGSTEACGLITYTADEDSLDFIAKSVGKVPAPMQWRLVDDDNRDVALGSTGEMVFRGPFLFKEYFNRPDANQAAFDAEGWFHSGDLAYADEQGNLFMTGRKSEMFKTGGENVFPREIEDVLEGHPAVMFAAVIAAPDEIFQEVGWAYIMRKPGQEVHEDELKSLCKEKLANFKVPKRFFIRDQLPLLSTGKVNKVELKKEVKAAA